MQAEAKISELVLLDGKHAARILCAQSLIPAPGRYLLAQADGSNSPLAASVFSAKSFSDGFICAPPVPESWIPGTRLNLRGPLGRGFDLPVLARRVALIAYDDSPRRLLALLDSISKQNASVTLICEYPPDDLPLQVEVQPMKAFHEVCDWADYIAIDAARESLPQLKKMLGAGNPSKIRYEAQILIRTSMPCAGLAECGVCTVEVRNGHRLACEDGPVFELREIV
jgi:dihydroorotate dehydrogenase electron transfer subunit